MDIISSNQSISNLTIADLENLIEMIIKRNLKQENYSQETKDNQTLLETFGKWEDNRTDEEIIAEIYSSRNSNLTNCIIPMNYINH
ncbi:MAG TPA: hypothetical protein V6C58_17215 [Allocoleopsis sp.]